MSWLRRIFGGSGDGHDGDSGDSRDAREDVVSEKAELFELLRARGARAALIDYDGGNDEGGVSSISTSTEPLGVAADDFTAEKLPGGREVERLWGDWSAEGYEAAASRSTDDERLLALGEEIVCAKWGSFAGEFEVEGRLVVDVDNERIVRQDVVRVWDEETEADGPPERETEVV